MSDEELKQNVSDCVAAAVEKMWLAVRSMDGERKLCRSAISATYFAVFNASKALLFACGIDTTSHEDVQRQFALHFVRSGTFPKYTSKHISELMSERHNADYKLYIPLGESDVAEDVKKAVEQFVRFEQVMRENGFGDVLEQHGFEEALAGFRSLADVAAAPP